MIRSFAKSCNCSFANIGMMTEKKQFRNKLELFVENPLYPSLRVKRIQGTTELFEFSVNMDIRVIWFYEGDDLVALVDIGHHDMLKKY